MGSFFNTNFLHFPRNENRTSGRYKTSFGKMKGFYLDPMLWIILFILKKKHQLQREAYFFFYEHNINPYLQLFEGTAILV